MPLLSLTTDLKSLKYGHDRPGGGDSGQPLIVVDINKASQTALNTGGLDMLLRGGGFLQDGRSVTDTLRLTKFFDSTSRGQLFEVQQNALAALSPRLTGGFPVKFSTVLAADLKGATPGGVYTRLSTLTQTLLGPLGLHVDKQGINPMVGGPKYMNLVKPLLGGERGGLKNIKYNRLVHLYGKKITSKRGSNDRNLFTYAAGPETGGIGNGIVFTTIKTSSTRTIFKGYGQTGPYKYSTLSTNIINILSDVSVDNPRSGYSNDFRNYLEEPDPSQLNVSLDYYYQNVNKRTNLNIDNNSSLIKNLSNKGAYTTDGTLNVADQINNLYVYKANQASTSPAVNDIVPFRIGIIDNNDPDFKTFIHYRAFVDSFDDGYSAQWSNFKYMGRGENFYTYQGFERNIGLSFTLAALSKPELRIMYEKLNFLISSLTPDYRTGYMRGNLVQLTFGGYLYEQPGIITDLKVNIDTTSNFELATTAIAGNETSGIIDDTVKPLPQYLKVSLSFIPIHTFLPQYNSSITLEPQKSRYIALEDENGSLYDSSLPYNSLPLEEQTNTIESRKIINTNLPNAMLPSVQNTSRISNSKINKLEASSKQVESDEDVTNPNVYDFGDRKLLESKFAYGK